MNKPEITRKILHIVFGILLLALTILLDQGIYIRILFILFLLAILLTVLHLKYSIRPIAWISKENEKRFPLKGLIFFIVGAGLASIIFERDIALASITILTFGDSICSIASSILEKRKIRYNGNFKHILGSFCGMVFAFLFALIFIDPISALVGSFFGLAAEAVAIKLGESDADDNIIVPLAAGTVMYLLTRLPLLASLL